MLCEEAWPAVSQCFSSFQRCSEGFEFRALCKTLEFLQIALGKPCLYEAHFVLGGSGMLEQVGEILKLQHTKNIVYNFISTFREYSSQQFGEKPQMAVMVRCPHTFGFIVALSEIIIFTLPFFGICLRVCVCVSLMNIDSEVWYDQEQDIYSNILILFLPTVFGSCVIAGKHHNSSSMSFT